MKRLKAFKAGGLVYRDKDKEEKREMYYVVCANFYVVRNLALCLKVIHRKVLATHLQWPLKS